MNNLDALKLNPELAKEISAKTMDTLVAELNAHGYAVTKDELISLAKQQYGDTALGSTFIYPQFMIV